MRDGVVHSRLPCWLNRVTALQHTMEEFIIAHQFPPMVHLERSNFWQISNAGKLILLAVVDPGSSTQVSTVPAVHLG